MRVHELAKELGLSSKALMDLLAKMKVAAKSHSSSLDDATAERVRQQVKGAAKAQQSAAPAAPARIAKTPTGERILGMRKIIPPPAPEPEPELQAEVQAPEPETAARVPAQAEPAPAQAKAAPPVAEPEAPARPAARAPQAPAAPKVAPKETRPARPSGMPHRPMLRPVPPRKDAPRGPAPDRPGGDLSPAAPAPATGHVRPGGPPPPRGRGRRRRGRVPPPLPTPPPAPPSVPAEIELSGPLAVAELAAKLELPGGEIVKRLLEHGILAGINRQIPLETAMKVVESFGSSVRKHGDGEVQAPAAPRRLEFARDGALAPRSPVVTILGHVDHGKTSLLDAIRKTDVAGKEFGGITQHIGASTVDADGRRIIFVDTPGHEAFTTLRARGAQVTDIAVLVVAADDGVMPQTVEAINHAKAAGVPIIVAINKVDLPQANPDRVKQQMAELGLSPEEWGGDTVTVAVSARTRQGLKELMEMIVLVTDLQELRADPARPARGTIIEARLDKGRGPVATVLVQEGMLRVGDAVVAGESYGRVRAMAGDHGDRAQEAGPSTPVEVVGLDTMPVAGDLLEVVGDDRLAKAVAEERRERRRATEVAVARPGAADEALQAGPKEVRLIIKADAHGSVEALTASLGRLAIPEVGVTILHAAVGNVSESDVMLAAASRAVVIGFNVRPEPQVRKLAETEQVEILAYRVIYEAIDDLRARLRGMLAPKRREVSLGQAEVRQTFSISKIGVVAGCYVTAGAIPRSATLRVIRDGVVFHEGKIASLRRFKDDVREVTEGFECGIVLERFLDVKVGDILEAFEIREEPA